MIKPRPAFHVAPFRFDVTPPIDHPLLGGLVMPAVACDDSLEAIGYVLFGSGTPIVVCVIDWAGLLNDAHIAWRRTLANAAGTSMDRVAVHCVHQHNAPLVCLDAHTAASRHADLPPMFDESFFESCLMRARITVEQAVMRPQRVVEVAHGQANVEHVASNRRVARDATGRVTAMRESHCKDPELVALPEGTIDATLQTVALYGEDGAKLIACHYYATHPMSYYRDGRVTSDFCGLARKRRDADEPGCTHLYFTGCAGDVAAGKYNDGSPASRRTLTARIHSAIVASEAALKRESLELVEWRTESIVPAAPPDRRFSDMEACLADGQRTHVDRLLSAFQLGWARRVERGIPLPLSVLRLNECSLLHLPGEMFIEYQLYARGVRPAHPVAVAAYGDGGPWYIPTKSEYPAGGYEVTVAFSPHEIEDVMREAIRRLLQ